jgi:uncharacterized protein
MNIDFENLQILPAFIGGMLIGLASVLFMLFNGRIAGISGLIAGFIDSLINFFYKPSLKKIFENRKSSDATHLFFLLGLLASPMVLVFFQLPINTPKLPSLTTLLIAGLLVGFGARLGSGCTSGHAVCGLSRLSMRSIVATIIFMLSAIITVFIKNHWL